MGFFDKFNRDMETSREYRKAKAEWKANKRRYERSYNLKKRTYENRKKNKNISTPVSVGLVNKLGDDFNAVKYPSYSIPNTPKSYSSFHEIYQQAKQIASPDARNDFIKTSLTGYIHKQYKENAKKRKKAEYEIAQENFKNIEDRRKSWENTSSFKAGNKRPEYEDYKKDYKEDVKPIRAYNKKNVNYNKSYASNPIVKKNSLSLSNIDYGKYGAEYSDVKPLKVSDGKSIYDYPTQFGEGKLDVSKKENVKNIKNIFNKIKDLFSNIKNRPPDLTNATAMAGVSDFPIDKKVELPDDKLTGIGLREKYSKMGFSIPDDKPVDVISNNIASSVEKLTGVNPKKDPNFWGEYWKNLDTGDKFGLILGIGQPFIRDLIGAVVSEVEDKGLKFEDALPFNSSDKKDVKEFVKNVIDKTVSGEGKQRAYDLLNLKVGNFDVGDMIVDVVTDPVFASSLTKGIVLNTGRKLGKDITKGIFKHVSDFADNINVINNYMYKPIEKSFSKAISFLKNNSEKLWNLLTPDNFINNVVRSGKKYIDDVIDKIGAKEFLGDDGLKVLKKEYEKIQTDTAKHLSLYFEVRDVFKRRITDIVKEVKAIGENLTNLANLMTDREGFDHYLKTHPNVNPKLVDIAKRLRKDLDTLVKKDKKIKYRKGYLPGTLRDPLKRTDTLNFNPLIKEYWLSPQSVSSEFKDISEDQFLVHLTNRFAHQIGAEDLKVVGQKVLEFTDKLKQLVDIPEIIKDKLLSGLNISKEFEMKFNKDLAFEKLGKIAHARPTIKKVLERELNKLVDKVKGMKLSMREVNRALFYDLPKGQLEKKSVIWDVVKDFQNKVDNMIKKVLNDPLYNPKSDPEVYSKIKSLGNEYKNIAKNSLGEIPKNISRNEFVSKVKDKLFYDFLKRNFDDVKSTKLGLKWKDIATSLSDDLFKDVDSKNLTDFTKVLFVDDDVLDKFSNFTYEKIAQSGLKISPDNIPHIFDISVDPVKKSRVKLLLQPLKVAGVVYDSVLKLWKDTVLIGRGSAWATKNFIDDVVKPLIESVDSYLDGKPLNLFTRSLKNAGNVTIDEILNDIQSKIPNKYYEKIIGSGLYDVKGNKYFSTLAQESPEVVKKIANIYDDVTGFMYRIFGKPEHITRLKYGTALLRSKLKELGGNYTETEIKRILNDVIDGVNRVFFSYEKTPLDKSIEKVLPFFYWNRENLKYFGEKFAKHPYLLTQIVRFKEKLNKANEHLPLRVRDKIRVPIKQINDSLTGIGEVYLNPISLFSVNFIDKFLREKPQYLIEKEKILSELKDQYDRSDPDGKKKLLITYPELSEYMAYNRLSGVKKVVDVVDNLFGIYPLIRYMGEYVGIANPTPYKTVLPYTNLFNAVFGTHFGVNPKNVEFQKESEKKAIKKLALIYDGDILKAKEVYHNRKLLKELSGFFTGIYPEFLNKAEVQNYRLMQIAYGDDPVALKENYILRKSPELLNSILHTGEDLGDGYYRLKADLLYKSSKPQKEDYQFGPLYHLDNVIDFSEWIINNTNRLAVQIPKVQNGELPTYNKIESVISEPYKANELKKIAVVNRIVNQNKDFFSNLVYTDEIQKSNSQYKLELAKINDDYLNGNIDNDQYEKLITDLAIKYKVSSLAKKLISDKYMVVNSNSINTKYNIIYNDVKAGKIKSIDYLYNLMKDNGLIINKDGYEVSLVSKDRLKYLLNLFDYTKNKEKKKEFYDLRDQVYKLSDENKINEAIKLLDENKNQFIDDPKFNELYNNLIKKLAHKDVEKYFELPDDEKVKIWDNDKSKIRELMTDRQFKYFSQIVESIKLKNKLKDIENFGIEKLTPEFVASVPDKYKWIVSKKISEYLRNTDDVIGGINKVSELIKELPESEYEKIIKPIAVKYMMSWYDGKGLDPIELDIGGKKILIDDKYITLHYNSKFIDQKIQNQLRQRKKELYPKYRILAENNYDVDYLLKTKQLTKEEIDEINKLFEWVPSKIEESRKNREYGMWLTGLYKLPYKKRHEYYWKMPDWVRERFYRKFKFNY